jgi:hypothetical protein
MNQAQQFWDMREAENNRKPYTDDVFSGLPAGKDSKTGSTLYNDASLVYMKNGKQYNPYGSGGGS